MNVLNRIPLHIFQQKQQHPIQHEILNQAECFRNIATELNNIAVDLYAEGDNLLSMDLYKDATKAMMTVIQPQQALQQLSFDEARMNFIAKIMHGKQILHNMRSPSSTAQVDGLNSYQWSDSDNNCSPRCLSEAMKLDRLQESITDGSCNKDGCYSAYILYNMGLIHVKSDKSDLAEQLFDMAMTLKENSKDISKDFDRTLLFAALSNNLGYIQYKHGQIDQALERFYEAFQLGQQLLNNSCARGNASNDAEIIRVHKYVGTILCNIGMTNASVGLHDTVVQVLNCSLMILKMAIGDHHPDIAAFAHDIGMVHLESGRVNDAIKMFKESLQVSRSVFGNNHICVAKGLYYLGQIHDMKGEYNEALHAYQEVLHVERMALGLHHPDVAVTLCQIGQIHHSRGDLEKSLKVYHDALAIMRALCDQQASIVSILQTISTIYLESGKTNEAMMASTEVNDMMQLVLEHAVENEEDGGNRFVIDTIELVQMNILFGNPPSAAAA